MSSVLADIDTTFLLLAQPETQATDAATTSNGGTSADGTQGPPPSGFDPTTMILIFGAVILFMFMLGGGSRKQRKKQQEMLASMAKGDKIVTIGGIKGSLVEVRDNEVIVKVDENNNTRMKFSKDAVREVIKDKDKDE